MNQYRPITPKAQGYEEQGIDPQTVQEIDQLELAKEDYAGQQAILQLPGGAELLPRVGQEIAGDPVYRRRIASGETGQDVYMSAAGKVKLQADAAPDPGTGRGRVTPGVRLDPSTLGEAQQAYRAVGELSPSLVRQLGYGSALSHPDAREEPGLGRG